MADEPTLGEALRRLDRTDRDVRDLRSDIPRWIADAMKPVADSVAKVERAQDDHERAHENAATNAVSMSWAKISALAAVAGVLIAMLTYLGIHGGH